MMNPFIESLLARQAFLFTTGPRCALRVFRSIGFDDAYTCKQWYGLERGID